MSNLANGIHSVARRASDAAAVPERADPALVRADRVEQLYSQLPLGLAATVVIGVIAAVELHEGRLIELLVVWGGLLAAVVILHGLLIPLFYGASVAVAYRLNGVFVSGYRLRHAYQRSLVELDEAGRQIEASGRKLALFAERSPIAVFELDGEAMLREVNQAAEI